MNSNRKIAVVTGVLFIIATVTSLLAKALTPDLVGTNYLTEFSAHANQAAVGALLCLIAAFASAGIAVSMYPVLKEQNAGLALGSVVFRTLEAAFYMVGVLSLLTLLTLGQQFTGAGAADRALLLTIGDSMVSVHQHASLLAVFGFTLGAWMYYYLFFRSWLMPRWLSGAGIVAVVLMLAACVLALLNDKPVSGYVLLAFPIGLQELVLAVWLIVKGFSPSLGAFSPEKTGTQELLAVP